MEHKKLTELEPHPKNEYYFDDIKDDKWESLLESIRLNGVLEPILITEPHDNNDGKWVIISGHQRVRACKELGINKIPYTYKSFESEDEILLALIESNITQRGIGNPNPLKLGRCLNELDRIYGIKRGNNQYSNPNNLDSKIAGKSKKSIASKLSLSQETLKNYQKLTLLDDELQEMILNDKLLVTSATQIAKKVPKEKQKELAAKIKSEEKITGSKIAKIIEEINQTGIDTKTVQSSEKDSAEEITADFVFPDLESYVTHGKVYFDDEDELNPLSALDILKKSLKDIHQFSEIAHKMVDSTCFNLKELKELLENNTSIVEIADELRENNVGFCAGTLKSIIDDASIVAQCIEVIVDAADNMLILENEKVMHDCDSDGFVYNGAGKKIGEIENYKKQSLICEYIEKDKNEDVWFAYDEDKNKIGKVLLFE